MLPLQIGCVGYESERVALMCVVCGAEVVEYGGVAGLEDGKVGASFHFAHSTHE